MIRPGQCFKIECTLGDGQSSWWVYRRVRATIAGFAECHRFEIRSSYDHVLSYVLCHDDPVPLTALVHYTEIPETEWRAMFNAFCHSVSEPWNAEHGMNHG